MRHHFSFTLTATIAVATALLLGGRLSPVQGQAPPQARTDATAEKGGQDVFGAYDVVPNWPKPLSSLPGHEKWTYGAGQSVFAESPNRVFILQRGELPVVERPKTIKVAPSIE